MLVFALALPILALALYNGIMLRSGAEAREREQMRLIAELTSQRPQQLIHGVRQLLFSMTGQIDVLLRSREECQAYFSRLLPGVGDTYRAIGVALPDGSLHCNSAFTDAGTPVNISDRSYFRMAVDSGKFTVGVFQVGRVTGEASLNFAYPVLDTDKRVIAVVYAALNLDTFIEQGELRREAERWGGAGRVVSILDRNGTLLAQYPRTGSRIGDREPGPKVLEQMAQARRGMFLANDRTGSERFYIFENVGMNPDGVVPIRVLVSMPVGQIFAESDQVLRRTLIGIGLVTLLVLVGAWYGAEILLLRRFRRLLDVAEKVGGGDLNARTGFGPGNEELTRLGAAFDKMAGELLERDRELKRMLDQLNEQALTDHLTGLHNRRYLWDAFNLELVRARRRKSPLAVVVMDVDHFKKINDRWGHEAGDLVLKNVAQVIRRVVRATDIVVRLGGEEFVVVLPETGLAVAQERAEALRAEIAGLQLTFGGVALGAITLSAGVALSLDLHESAEELVSLADAAMYKAKQGGRNRVVIAGREPESCSASVQG